MESGRDGKTVEEWDENLLLQRLCEAFKKAKAGGQKHVAVSDFHEHMEGLELGAVLEILNGFLLIVIAVVYLQPWLKNKLVYVQYAKALIEIR